MSDRHVHTTSFIYDTDPQHIEAFLKAAREVDRGFFNTVLPIRRPADSRMRVTNIVLYSSDLDGISNELAMPGIVEQLAGILDRDITIVSAWENGPVGRECVWPVPGRATTNA